MRKQAPVAVPKVQSPDLDVLVSRPTDQKGAVRGDVHTQHRQLVTVQGQEELEGVCEEELDGGVKQRHSYQLACTCMPHTALQHCSAAMASATSQLRHMTGWGPSWPVPHSGCMWLDVSTVLVRRSTCPTLTMGLLILGYQSCRYKEWGLQYNAGGPLEKSQRAAGRQV